MPITVITIGDEVSEDKLEELGAAALSNYYHADGNLIPVSNDYVSYFRRCAEDGKPIVLTRTDGAFVKNTPPAQMPLHEFLGENSISFRAFRPPSEGVDGYIEVWNQRVGSAVLPATAQGEPLISCEEMGRISDAIRRTESVFLLADMNGVQRHMRGLRDNPGPVVIVGVTPRFR